MTAVESAVAECDATIAAQIPKVNGLRVLARLDLKPDTAATVNAAIADYDQYQRLLKTARDANQAVVDFGHPMRTTRVIREAAFDELQEENAAADIGFAQFAPDNQAVSLNPVAGAAEPK
jgi:hypothetical protein